MGDVSIMARRLENGYVQYGWCGNGGYYKIAGSRLHDWYQDSEDVEYLFGLGQTRLIGEKGSENGGMHWFLTHNLTGEACWLDRTERMIFSKIMFIDYGYFYDLDHKWYYIIPGPFRIKMPLEIIENNLDENEYEFDFRKSVEDKVIRYILGEYVEANEEFRTFLEEEGYIAENVLKDITDTESNLAKIRDFYNKYKKIFSYFDDWVLIKTNDASTEISEIIVKKKSETHVETNEW